jgi:hypothetical protein
MMVGVDMDFCAAYLKLNRHRYPVIKESSYTFGPTCKVILI